MSIDELMELVKKAAFTSDEVEQWKDVIEDLSEEDRQELGKILELQVKEKDILTTKQANELAALKASWNMPEDSQN